MGLLPAPPVPKILSIILHNASKEFCLFMPLFSMELLTVHIRRPFPRQRVSPAAGYDLVCRTGPAGIHPPNLHPGWSLGGREGRWIARYGAFVRVFGTWIQDGTGDRSACPRVSDNHPSGSTAISFLSTPARSRGSRTSGYWRSRRRCAARAPALPPGSRPLSPPKP